ncbi:MAG: sensor histidine kinase [Actinomycetota bacterium]
MELDAPTAAVVVGDEGRLRQAVTNLVGNALVHAPEAAVRVGVRREGEEVVVQVADDGPGMSADDAGRAFERFYRADASRSRHQGGSGLGLAIVDAVVRSHGGTATIDTAPGQGTTVTVRLPAP